MPADDAAMTANDQPRAAVWSWLKHPWPLLIFGSVIALGLWVGIGIWIERQRAAALAELLRTPGIKTWVPLGSPSPVRYPIWLPKWFGDRLPIAWQANLQITGVNAWEFYRPLTDHELRLIDHLFGVDVLEFHAPQAISDEALQNILERQSLETLKFSQPRKLTQQHFDTLSRHEHLSALLGLQGPFSQRALDAVAQMKALRWISLEGSLEGSASFGSMPELYDVEWDHSQLSDDQFAGLATGTDLVGLSLRQTRLTAKSWPLLEKMDLRSLELESPHIDDAITHSLSGQKSLIRAELRGGNLSDSAIKELLALPKLYDLDVEGHDLTIASIRLIRARLTPKESVAEEIDLGVIMSTFSLVLRGGTHVTDDWLTELGAAQLSALGFVNSAITDEGVEFLKDRKNLYLLHLPGSRITDRSMAVFSTLTDLMYLDLRHTAITDAGLKQLSPKTRGSAAFALHVGGTQITKHGVEEFLSRYPDARVYGVDGIQPAGELHDLIPLDDGQPR